MIDSNQIAALIAALEAKGIPVLAAPVIANPNWMNPQVIGAIVMVAAAAAGYLQSRTASINAREARDTAQKAVANSEETKAVTADTAKAVVAIHTAVNSKETATAAELKRLGDIVLLLTQENATQAQKILENDKSDVRRAATKDAEIAQASAIPRSPPPRHDK